MTINQACQVWIEQRADEELTEREKTGKSLRSIGKEIAAEILKVFEVKVNSSTIFQRVRRAAERADTNVSLDATIESDSGNNTNQEIKLVHGGKREGAGRKPKGGEVKESKYLWEIKRLWRSLCKRDQKLFLKWMKNQTEEKDGE